VLHTWPFWAHKTVVIAGATGFLGGWLVRALLKQGAKVVSIVRNPKSQSQAVLDGLLDRTTVEHGSVYDRDFVTGLFDRHAVDVFFHAAYGGDVNRVLQEPLECFRSSVESTWLILETIRQRQPSCVTVVSSSDKAYGTQALPYRESSALTPLHPYEVAKASQDLAAQSFGKIYGLPVAVTRCGNFFGPYDFNLTRLLPSACLSVANGERPVLRSDGLATRDFVYVEDAAEAQMLLACRLADDPSLYGEAFNFSYGEPIEVREILRRVSALSGKDLQPVLANSVKSEIRHMHLSSEKAATLLRWKPRVGFEEGLRRTVDWYVNYFTRAVAT
jgi:CDP-glucose 4,6-dehydratase